MATSMLGGYPYAGCAPRLPQPRPPPCQLDCTARWQLRCWEGIHMRVVHLACHNRGRRLASWIAPRDGNFDAGRVSICGLCTSLATTEAAALPAGLHRAMATSMLGGYPYAGCAPRLPQP